MSIRKVFVLAAIVFSGLHCSESINALDSQDEVSYSACGGRQKGVGSLVSTQWLSYYYERGPFLIVDVRSAEEYAAGHIPNSVNIPFLVPFSLWTTMVNDLLVEMPEFAQLKTDLGEMGISRRSRVVLVTSLPTEANPYSLAAPTRVAMTLAYAGLTNITILDGGFDKWQDEGLPVTTEEPTVEPVTFRSWHASDMIVNREYVEEKLGKVVLIDARDAEVYTGEVIEPFADKAGHIPTAVSLPAPSLWNSDGTYKSRWQIARMARRVIGGCRYKEIIVYCGVGGYASTVWYALSRICHYTNVKVYDGSAQEWVLFNDMEM